MDTSEPGKSQPPPSNPHKHRSVKTTIPKPEDRETTSFLIRNDLNIYPVNTSFGFFSTHEGSYNVLLKRGAPFRAKSVSAFNNSFSCFSLQKKPHEEDTSHSVLYWPKTRKNFPSGKELLLSLYLIITLIFSQVISMWLLELDSLLIFEFCNIVLWFYSICVYKHIYIHHAYIDSANADIFVWTSTKWAKYSDNSSTSTSCRTSERLPSAPPTLNACCVQVEAFLGLEVFNLSRLDRFDSGWPEKWSFILILPEHERISENVTYYSPRCCYHHCTLWNHMTKTFSEVFGMEQNDGYGGYWSCYCVAFEFQIPLLCNPQRDRSAVLNVLNNLPPTRWTNKVVQDLSKPPPTIFVVLHRSS